MNGLAAPKVAEVDFEGRGADVCRKPCFESSILRKRGHIQLMGDLEKSENVPVTEVLGETENN